MVSTILKNCFLTAVDTSVNNHHLRAGRNNLNKDTVRRHLVEANVNPLRPACKWPKIRKTLQKLKVELWYRTHNWTLNDLLKYFNSFIPFYIYLSTLINSVLSKKQGQHI